VKFAFISEEKVAFPVAVLCRLLAVSPSGFYATQGRPRSLHGRRDDKLTEQVVQAHGTAARACTPSSKPPASGWAVSAWPG
jgi:hypothetical protein